MNSLQTDPTSAAKTLLSGLSNFSSTAPEDTIQYWIFPKNFSSHSPENSVAEGKHSASFLLQELLSFACKLSKNYIWHNEGFRLKIKEFPVLHFFGSSQFDENLEDEWFITYILFEISKKFEDLVVKIQDSDGEFLLIEAADFLPKWLNPHTAENRVFIHRGSLHIIPSSKHQSKNANTHTFPESISDPRIGAELVLQYPELTLAPATIQSAIRDRLRGFAFSENGGKSNWHRAKALLPPKIALILKEKPHLISDATRAFYLRDSFDLKACREMRYFPPPQRLEDLSFTSVKFSKHLFAMIQGQKFQPDKRSGWVEILEDAEKAGKEKYLNLGMKVTCGFEILCSRSENAKNRKSKGINCEISQEFSEIDNRWPDFLKSLKRNGFFKGEREGSKMHSDLVFQAKSFFESSVMSSGEDTSAAVHHPGEEVMKFVHRQLSKDQIRMLGEEEAREDDESWLNVTAEDLDGTLGPSGGTGVGTVPNGYGSDDADDEDDIGDDVIEGNRGRMRQKKVKHQAHGRKPGHQKDQVKELGQKVVAWVEKGSGPATEGAEAPKYSTPKKQNSKDAKGSDADPCARSIRRVIDMNVGESVGEEDSSDMESYDEDELQIDLSEEAMKEMRNWGKDMRDYMKQMDKELAGTSIGKSFKNKKLFSARAKSKSPAADSIDLEDDGFTPVDIDRNLVTNMLQSYWSESQSGQSGPASSLLHSLKLRPPKERAELDSDDFEEEFGGEEEEEVG